MRIATTVLIVCVAALLAAGAVFISSALMTARDQSLFYKQLVFCGLGLVACALFALTDYRLLKRIAWPLYVVGIITLVAALLNGKINGSARWINVGGLSLQTSEVAKLSLLVALAAFTDRFQRKMSTFKHGVWYPGLFVAPMLILILAEPDFGTTATLGAVAGAMLLVGGVRWPHLLLAGLIGGSVVGAALVQNPNRMDRINEFFQKGELSEKGGRQDVNATRAVGLGGGFGLGLGDDPYKGGKIYAQHSDAIFSVIGAEVGLLGSMTVLLLYVGFLASSIYIAWHARDVFGMLLATGLCFFICLQAIIHLAGVTGLIPLKGFPLPFLSHGGSNVMFNLLAVGIIFSIARRGIANVKAKNPFERHIDVPVAEAA